jgi:hypothetical protein
LFSFGGARDGYQDLGIAHFKVRGAIGGGLCRDLRVDPTQLIPPATVEAEERKGIGRRIERHVGDATAVENARIVLRRKLSSA